jgi:hypothetical protein
MIVISGIAITASAQAPVPPPAPTPFSGPTVSTNVPFSSTPVDHFICSGGQVSLISPTSGVTNYLWWKENSAGSWVLVGNTPSPTNTYTESSTTPGYYTYKVQTENSLGCESPISNPINIFALPPITATITPPMNVCQTITSIPAPFALTVTPNDYSGTYTYSYQWFRDNGSGAIDIPGATSPTISNLTETTPGTVTYGVRISYVTALGQSVGTTTCTVTKTTTVTVVAAPTTPIIQWN